MRGYMKNTNFDEGNKGVSITEAVPLVWDNKKKRA